MKEQLEYSCRLQKDGQTINVNGKIWKKVFEFKTTKGCMAMKMHGKNRGDMKIFTSWLCFTID